jgi:hypothetical protein
MVNKTCFECGKSVDINTMQRWYHGDQDDLVCQDCANSLQHTDTVYAGTYVSTGRKQPLRSDEMMTSRGIIRKSMSKADALIEARGILRTLAGDNYQSIASKEKIEEIIIVLGGSPL